MRKLTLILIAVFALCFSLHGAEKPADAETRSSQGPATDRANNPVEDPSRNQRDLVLAEARRQDDLRAASDLLNKERGDHINFIGELRSLHQKEMRVADRSEATAIRLVDREDVAKTTTSANNAISALAKQTSDISTTLAKQTSDISAALAKQVQDTAIANDARQAAFSSDVYKRIQVLENASSERSGNQAATAPMMEKMFSRMDTYFAQASVNTGKSEGVNSTFYLILAIGGGVLALLTYNANQNRKNGQYMRKNGGAT